MIVKQSVNFCDFCDAFRAMDRNEQFTYEAKRIIFDYLEEYEASTGEEIELDVIAICCDYRESTFEEVAQDYRIDVEYDDDADDDDEKADALQEAVIDYLGENSFILGLVGSDSVVFQVF